MPPKVSCVWKRFLLLILCMLLTSFFISAQNPAQPPAENRASPDKEVMVVRKGIRIDRTADTLPTSHPVILIELHSERLFDGRNQIHSLRIGSHEFTKLIGMVFELTPREFAKTKTGDEVVVRYGATNPIKKSLLRDWHFGRLDKTEVDRRPVKTFEGTSIGDTPTYSKDGKLIHAGPPIKIRSRTRDTRTNVPIISVTDENMFPQRWLSSPIEARATRLSKKELKRSIYILDVAMSKYPILLLRENIKAIYLLNSLTLYGVAADASNSADSIYVVNTGDKEYTDEYLESSFHRAFGNLMLQKNNQGRDSGRWDMARFAPQKRALEMPAADPLMKLVYKANEGSPDYIYALENTGFMGVTLFKQFKEPPRDEAIRCQLRCREVRRPLPAALQETIKQHSFVYHRELVDVAPVWSHAGKQIAFQSIRADHDVTELYVMQVDGSNLRRLTHTAYSISQTTGFSAAVWSPDDRQLAYVMHPGGPGRLFTVNADGTGRKELLVENTGIELIGWLPDRRILILVVRIDRSRSVYSVLPDGTGLTRFTEGDNRVGPVFLAPDQNQIAIAAAGNLIIKDLKTNTVSQSTSALSIHAAAWSPDSKQIAYKAYGGLTITDLKSNTSRSSPSDSNEAVSGISWSPDGKQIAYVGARNLARGSASINELRVVNADGTGGRRLTAEGFGPVWSPDGKYIIFSRTQARMYLIRPDGSGERYLSHGVWARWIP